MLRQGCNQAVNFTAYQYIKARVMDYQGTEALLPWQSLLIGGFSGGMGPLVNNPLGTCYAEHVYCCLLLKFTHVSTSCRSDNRCGQDENAKASGSSR